eukprot:TRINITY_DN973_c0_g2_i1.p1 TRINITY_DN973_c0_g2~~TRINITY_DN973_c0_g2_i1.p1  ORF type:complete len:725 (+),score=241.63 TRINITY_DN973_c0_g2_i1:81-2177(+)
MAAALSALALAGLPWPVPTQPPSAFDSLNRLLAPLRLTPPDINVTKGDLSVALKQIECANISLGDLSLPSAPLSGGGSEAAVVLSNLSLSCQAVLTEDWSPLPAAKGDKVAFNATLDALLEFAMRPSANDSAKVPSVLGLERCSVGLPVLDMSCAPKIHPICLAINSGGFAAEVRAAANLTVCAALKVAGKPAETVLRLVAELLEQWADPVPSVSVAASEAYLAPYRSQIATWSRHGKFARLGRMVDMTPARVIDLMASILFRHGKVTVPINASIPLRLPAGLGNATLTLGTVEVGGVDSFTTLKPFDLESGLTWRMRAAMKRLSIAARARLTLAEGSTVHGLPPGGALTLQVSIPTKGVSVDASVIVALNSSRLCELDAGGAQPNASIPCAAWPIVSAAGPNTIVSGLNVTRLSVSLADLDMTVSGLGAGLDGVVNGAIAEVLTTYKPALLRALPNGLSEAVKDAADEAAYYAVAREQRRHPCADGAGAPAVSRVCVLNQVLGAISWRFRDCGAGAESKGSGDFVTGGKRCMDVGSLTPPGGVVRVLTDAVLGKRQLAAEALRSDPAAASEAVYSCRGVSLDYKCKLDSVTPTGGALKVSKICVANDAAFVLKWHATDRRTKAATPSSGDYATDQTRCMELSTIPGVAEGDAVEATVHAVLGRSKAVSAAVTYAPNGLGATFVCRGVALLFRCELLV